jgi:uncharacterized protein involved in exopolysaccharide biosynthesis
MADEKNTPFDFDSSTLLVYIVKKFKVLVIVGIIAFVVSAIVSFLIEPKYKSTVTMFPVSSASVSKSLLSKNYVSSKDLQGFGDEGEAEQLLQVLNSEELSSRVIQKFDLMKHYEINPKSKYPMTALGNAFKENFKFSKTEYMSVEIDVLDKDPKMSADMANYASDLIDTVMNNMHHERAQRAFDLVKNEYENVQKDIKVLEDSLSVIRKAGVNDYKSMSKVFNEAYAKALLKDDNKTVHKIEDKISVLSKYGSPYLSMTYLLEQENLHLSDIKAKYAEAKVDLEQNLPYKFIVDRAVPSEKKDSPKRMLIVIVSVFAAEFFALLALIILDSVRKALNKA